MKNFSLIAVDLDGTLLTGGGQLAVQGAQLLAQAARQGVRVVLSTARTPMSTRLYCQQLQVQDPIICINGAKVLGSPDGPTWLEELIPREAAGEIAGLADECGWELAITVGSQTYWRQRPGQPLGLLSSHIIVVRTNAEMVVDSPLRILASQPEAVAGLKTLCELRLSQACRAEVFLNEDGTASSLGIFPAQADKGSALRLVLERLEINSQQVMAIGDNLVDLPMFAVARLSIAMGNAPEVVKRQAAIVAPGHEEEGVAWAIRTFLL